MLIIDGQQIDPVLAAKDEHAGRGIRFGYHLVMTMFDFLGMSTSMTFARKGMCSTSSFRIFRWTEDFRMLVPVILSLGSNLGTN